MSIIPNNFSTEKSTIEFSQFFKKQHIAKLMKKANFSKEAGIPFIEIFKVVFLLIFGQKNLFQTLLRSNSSDQLPGKDTIYRFLNSCRCNWRKFLLSLSSDIIKNQFEPLTSGDRVKVLIVDDSLYSRNRSKEVELLARVHDHVTQKFVKGFRMLTVGWSDGNSFIPLAFSLLSSEKEENRLCSQNETIDKRTAGYKRRTESTQKSTDTLFDLLKQVKDKGIVADYLLFDSWFAFPKTIIKVLGCGFNVISIIKATPKIHYTYEGNKLDLNDLYAKLRKKRGKAKILTSAEVILGIDDKGNETKAKIVFVRDRNRSKKWLALLSTDLEISEKEIVSMYGKRWDIEVFFKMTKSFLGLAKEFQGRSYDMMFAHATQLYLPVTLC